MVDHDKLINALALAAVPVTRPAPAALRALLWMLIALPLGYLASRPIAMVPTDWTAPGADGAMANAALSLLIGALMLVWAFTTSIAGRSFPGRFVCGALLVAWVGVMIVNIVSSANPVGDFGEGKHCFIFIVLASLPMSAVTIFALRRTGSLRPLPTLGLAGAGIGFLSFGLLAFCHTTELDLIDFSLHAAAAIVVSGMTMLCGYRWVAA